MGLAKETTMQREQDVESRTGGRAEVHHPLSERDRATVAALRVDAAPFKGKMSDPSARAPFDAIMEHTPEPIGLVDYEQAVVGGVPGFWCVPRGARSTAAILYLHGGAYLLGSAAAYRHFAGQFAARTNTRAFIADYRLAPEHPFPAALDDARAAYRGVVATGAQQVAIVGDSAGGGLALALLSAAHADAVAGRGVPPVGAVVMSPWADLALTGGSMAERADEDPLVTRDMLRVASASYLGDHDPRDPQASPLYGDLAGLPPVQLHVGTSEVLLDDTLRFAARARDAGVDATAHVWEGMPHVFPSSLGALDAADQAFDVMAGFLRQRLGERSKVLLIGLEPSLVDYASLPTKLDEPTLRAMLDADVRRLRELGYDADWLLVDLGETAGAVLSAKLQSATFACVLIGAGIRTIPPLFLLFEQLINVVHERAPGARVCFNTRPDDTAESVQRWI
jgi:acetyl esterase/lipase